MANFHKVLVFFFAFVFFFQCFGTRRPIDPSYIDPQGNLRDAVVGKKFMVATGNPLATKAAIKVLESGGNAVDAAVAALLVLNVTNGEAASFPSVAPTLIYDQKTGQVKSYIGAGTAPKKANIDWFKENGYDVMPKNSILSQLLPASPDVIVRLLQDHGTKSFSELVQPAIVAAEVGFPANRILVKNLDLPFYKRLGFTIIMPYNSEVYLEKKWWYGIREGELTKRLDLAKTWRSMANEEVISLKKGKTRKQALESVRDYFYKGPISDAIVKLHTEKNGLFTKEDLANYSGGWEKPVSGEFGEYKILSNQTWTQGPVVPMVLQLLDGINLKALGHNSPEYIHTVSQAIELVVADREKYFGDPKFLDVPLEGLLSKKYASLRRKLIQKDAFGATPPFGNPWTFDSKKTTSSNNQSYETKDQDVSEIKYGKDTTYLSIIDAEGNAVSLTPSDFPQSPMVPGTGLTLGIRMTQFRLDPNHPSALAPGKRPRITPNPGMVLKKGKLWMSFGTPGGDVQSQAMIQFFLNIIVFGMDPQKAVEAPRFRSVNWPDSFSPHTYRPGGIELEETLYTSVSDSLRAKGYKVYKKGHLDNDFGAVCAVLNDEKKLIGVADPREESWAEGK
ncbi:gamma-glutamyltransferase [Leptospira sp. 2 VSF19]|uniref:Gamma-glutamyltransferase n=1 Tax=Leptospira soteropolitanensis TaxID=2950025 RepID=A0AAW5VIP4_9LEPT|nr:gamma-glutamyltransferase [Leptospira soteropolitanensis]MCW7491927.1 gamma-glutamyltransferase [Leptospira soteropolitanensis]MCW7499511.1 gamma-glutamyltransferase [Leptospira soteropolitanensis]MCW7520898.1 gamma-glutamyltransferase [Leptospira soteropolitanensis]MCW7525615.1 gamma-glutamyltransferase [Leptospira soteropolitanensis]MCW7529481.1 gamma-glutamyltransferase [Leptospira soteropolitanensis]